jgi:transcriptional repressor NrdR
MDRLRKLDPIAYIRFASVYRSYPDILAMRDEMEHILQTMHANGDAGEPTPRATSSTAAAEEPGKRTK